MKKIALALMLGLIVLPVHAKRHIIDVDGDKINVIGNGNANAGAGVRDNPNACMQSALACNPTPVIDPPPVVNPPVVQPPVVQPPVVQPPVVQPPVVQPPVVQPPVVQPPVVQPPVVTPPVVTPPVVTPPVVTPPVVTPPVVQPPTGFTQISSKAVPCVQGWAFCKDKNLTENRAKGKVIDEVIYYDFP